MSSEILRELLEYLAQGLVDEPEEVSVEQFEEDDGTVVLELCVADEDYGQGDRPRRAHRARAAHGREGRRGRRGAPRARRHRRLRQRVSAGSAIPRRAARRNASESRSALVAKATRERSASVSSRAVPAGRVGRAHGLDGSFYVTGARPRLLPLGTTVTLDGSQRARSCGAQGTDAAPDRAPGGRRGSCQPREALRGHGADRRGSARPRRWRRASGGRTSSAGCEVVDGERRVGTVIAADGAALVRGAGSRLVASEATAARGRLSRVSCSCRW